MVVRGKRGKKPGKIREIEYVLGGDWVVLLCLVWCLVVSHSCLVGSTRSIIQIQRAANICTILSIGVHYIGGGRLVNGYYYKSHVNRYFAF
jgi:uncharacterized SAM-binding protein YcdF (DUF218 family)